MKIVTKFCIYDLTGRKIFFTSDLHLGAARTLEFSKRPFGTVAEMDMKLLNNITSTVGPEDVLVDLGDHGDFSWKINCGTKFFLRGNYEPKEVAIPTDYIELQSEDYLELDDGTKLYFIHEPEKGQHADRFYLFGHVHQLSMIKRNGLNVGTDCHQYRPIDLERVLFYKTAIEKFYDGNVFQDTIGKL